MGDFYTVRQTADIFGVKPRAVRDWIRRELLKAKKDRFTGTVYVPREEIERRKAHLEDWQPGVQPVTITGAQPQADALTSRETDEETPTMAQKKPETTTQDETQAEAPAKQQQQAPRRKKSEWGTVLDDDEEDA